MSFLLVSVPLPGEMAVDIKKKQKEKPPICLCVGMENKPSALMA